MMTLAVLAGCSSPAGRPGFPGVRPYLVLLDASPAVGSPLRVRLDLVNDSDAAVLYDDQRCTEGTFEIVGADGRPVPFVDGPRSTIGSYKALAPRSAVTLKEEIDLSEHHQLSKPGRYTIRCYGEIGVVDAAAFARLKDDDEYFEKLEALEGWAERPSNDVTVELRPGTVPEQVLVAGKVRAALPEGWSFAVNWVPPRTGDPEYSLFVPGGRKSASVVFRLSLGPPLEEETRVGEARGKSLYVTSSAEGEKAWPDHRRRLLEILNSR